MTQDSLTSATVHGLKWSYLSTIVNALLQLAVTAVLARMLTPSAFGLVAMATVFLRFGQYFAQLGAGQAVVQKAELSPQDIRTAFTSSLLMGAAFCGIFILLAPIAGLLFPDTAQVTTVARVMSLTFLLNGVTTTTQGLLQRRFAFRAIALTEIGSYVLGYALVGLLLAALGLGAWSLVAATLCASALAAVVFTVLARKEIGFGWSGRSFRSIYSFGWRISLVGLGEFLGSNLDTLWTGHFLGSRAMGLYTRATNLANVSLYYFTVSLSRVLLPGFSRIQSEPLRLRSVYLTSLNVVAAIVMPVAWGISGASKQVIATLLGPQWGAAVPVLAILALAVPFSLLMHFAAVLCDATARLNVRIAITVGRILWLAALLAFLARYGIVGIAFAYATSEVISYFAYIAAVRGWLALGASDLVRAQALGVGTGLVVGGLLYGLSVGLGTLGWPAPVILAVQVAVGVVCLTWALVRGERGRVWWQIRSRLADAGYGAGNGGLIAGTIRVLDRFARGDAPATGA